MHRHIQNVCKQKDKKSKPEAIGPKVLSVQHLWLALNFVVLIAECAPKLFKKLKMQFEM
jgi:hypothetical protein